MTIYNFKNKESAAQKQHFALLFKLVFTL